MEGSGKADIFFPRFLFSLMFQPDRGRAASGCSSSTSRVARLDRFRRAGRATGMERRTKPALRTILPCGRADAIDQDCTSAGRDSDAATDEGDIDDRVFRRLTDWKADDDGRGPSGLIHSCHLANSFGG